MFKTQIEEYINERLVAKKGSLEIADWLDSAAKRASQISIATHVIKFTHSDSKGSSVFYRNESGLKNDSPYVTSDSVNHLPEDIVGNAAALDVAGLLQLESEGIKLWHLINEGDFRPFESFTNSKERLESWMSGLRTALDNKNISSHSLVKQVYFPIGDDEYHLLSPLFPSSLYQVLHDKISDARYGEVSKVARDCKNKKIYSEHVLCDYPNLAVQQFGGSKPQNISKLNSKRVGKAYLLSSTPPVWKKIARPPKHKFEFWKIFGYRNKGLLKDIKFFLIVLNKSNNHKNLRNRREKYFDLLIDLLMSTADEIKNFSSGWSSDSEIAHYEKIWLDPQKEGFDELQADDDWKIEVSKQFARWVSYKLRPDKEEFVWGDTEIDELATQCLSYLKIGGK